jgi:hypothetical protein
MTLSDAHCLYSRWVCSCDRWQAKEEMFTSFWKQLMLTFCPMHIASSCSGYDLAIDGGQGKNTNDARLVGKKKVREERVGSDELLKQKLSPR